MNLYFRGLLSPRSFKGLLPVETATPEETVAMGRELAGMFFPGLVVALYGDLGAGKTHLVKGICTGLGVPEPAVTSPTFTIVNEYAGRDYPIFHIDAYRIKSVGEFYELGYEEYFFGDALCLVEWPDRIEELLPDSTVRIRMEHLGGDRRGIFPGKI